MKILSLFDGIACGYVAFQRAGIPIEKYYASEIDKYAIQIALKNHPDIIEVGDVLNLDFAQYKGKIDIIIGGSPCQDLSIAKQNREGLRGERSRLFWAYLDALRVIQPKYFLLENVASMTDENRDAITEQLKLLYPNTTMIMINSALVSAQQRKRYYWTNWGVKQPEDKGILLKDIIESGEPYQQKALALTTRYSGALFPHDFPKHKKTMIAEPVRIGQIGKGGQGDRIYSVCGKSVCLNANGGGRGAKTGLYKIDLPDGDYVVRKLTPTECEKLQTLPVGYTEGVSTTQRYKALGNGWTVDVIAHILKETKE